MLKSINELNRLSGADLDAMERVFREVLHSGWFVLGPHTDRFEQEFASYCGCGEAIGVANGTDALEIGLRALGIGPADVVLCAANAGFYGSNAILTTGAEPRYVDVCSKTLTVTAETLEHTSWNGVKAVIVTHLYGLMAPMQEITDLARSKGVPVIEDCAQAHGAMLDGRAAGSWGTLGCFSFYPTKNLGALGDGGAVVTSDADVGRRVRQLRQYGWKAKYEVTMPHGRNSRLDELQAAFLSAKLPSLDSANVRRRAIATRYVAGLDATKVRVPPVIDQRYVAHLFVVRSSSRDALRMHLKASGIPSDVHYPTPDHHQSIVQERYRGIHLPECERACLEVLTLPCFPEMTDAEVDAVIEGVNAWSPR